MPSLRGYRVAAHNVFFVVSLIGCCAAAPASVAGIAYLLLLLLHSVRHRHLIVRRQVDEGSDEEDVSIPSAVHFKYRLILSPELLTVVLACVLTVVQTVFIVVASAEESFRESHGTALARAGVCTFDGSAPKGDCARTLAPLILVILSAAAWFPATRGLSRVEVEKKGGSRRLLVAAFVKESSEGPFQTPAQGPAQPPRARRESMVTPVSDDEEWCKTPQVQGLGGGAVISATERDGLLPERRVCVTSHAGTATALVIGTGPKGFNALPRGCAILLTVSAAGCCASAVLWPSVITAPLLAIFLASAASAGMTAAGYIIAVPDLRFGVSSISLSVVVCTVLFVLAEYATQQWFADSLFDDRQSLADTLGLHRPAGWQKLWHRPDDARFATALCTAAVAYFAALRVLVRLGDAVVQQEVMRGDCVIPENKNFASTADLLPGISFSSDSGEETAEEDEDVEVLEKSFEMQVTCVRGENFIPCDRSGTSDPYVQLDVAGNSRQRSKEIPKTLSPQWDQTLPPVVVEFESDTDRKQLATLQFTVWDKNTLQQPSFMGYATAQISITDCNSLGNAAAEAAEEDAPPPPPGVPPPGVLVLALDLGTRPGDKAASDKKLWEEHGGFGTLHVRIEVCMTSQLLYYRANRMLERVGIAYRRTVRRVTRTINRLVRWTLLHSARLLSVWVMLVAFIYPSLLSLVWICFFFASFAANVASLWCVLDVILTFASLILVSLFVTAVPGVLGSGHTRDVLRVAGIAAADDENYSVIAAHSALVFLISLTLAATRLGEAKAKEEPEAERDSPREAPRRRFSNPFDDIAFRIRRASVPSAGAPVWAMHHISQSFDTSPPLSMLAPQDSKANVRAAWYTMLAYQVRRAAAWVLRRTQYVNLVLLLGAGFFAVDIISTVFLAFCVVFAMSPAAAEALWPLLLVYEAAAFLALYSFNAVYRHGTAFTPPTHLGGIGIDTIGLRVYSSAWTLLPYVFLLAFSQAQWGVYRMLARKTKENQQKKKLRKERIERMKPPERCLAEFAVGSRVKHVVRGEGVVEEIDDAKRLMRVYFLGGERHTYAEEKLADGRIQHSDAVDEFEDLDEGAMAMGRAATEPSGGGGIPVVRCASSVPDVVAEMQNNADRRKKQRLLRWRLKFVLSLLIAYGLYVTIALYSDITMVSAVYILFLMMLTLIVGFSRNRARWLSPLWVVTLVYSSGVMLLLNLYQFPGLQESFADFVNALLNCDEPGVTPTMPANATEAAPEWSESAWKLETLCMRQLGLRDFGDSSFKGMKQRAISQLPHYATFAVALYQLKILPQVSQSAKLDQAAGRIGSSFRFAKRVIKVFAPYIAVLLLFVASMQGGGLTDGHGSLLNGVYFTLAVRHTVAIESRARIAVVFTVLVLVLKFWVQFKIFPDWFSSETLTYVGLKRLCPVDTGNRCSKSMSGEVWWDVLAFLGVLLQHQAGTWLRIEAADAKAAHEAATAAAVAASLASAAVAESLTPASQAPEQHAAGTPRADADLPAGRGDKFSVFAWRRRLALHDYLSPQQRDEELAAGRALEKELREAGRVAAAVGQVLRRVLRFEARRLVFLLDFGFVKYGYEVVLFLLLIVPISRPTRAYSILQVLMLFAWRRARLRYSHVNGTRGDSGCLSLLIAVASGFVSLAQHAFYVGLPDGTADDLGLPFTNCTDSTTTCDYLTYAMMYPTKSDLVACFCVFFCTARFHIVHGDVCKSLYPRSLFESGWFDPDEVGCEGDAGGGGPYGSALTLTDFLSNERKLKIRGLRSRRPAPISARKARPGLHVRMTPNGCVPFRDVCSGVISAVDAEDGMLVEWCTPDEGGPRPDLLVPESAWHKHWWWKEDLANPREDLPRRLRRTLPPPASGHDFVQHPQGMYDRMAAVWMASLPALVLLLIFIDATRSPYVSLLSLGKLIGCLYYIVVWGDLKWRGDELWHHMNSYYLMVLVVHIVWALPTLAKRDSAALRLVGLVEDDGTPRRVDGLEAVIMVLLYMQRLNYDDFNFVYILYNDFLKDLASVDNWERQQRVRKQKREELLVRQQAAAMERDDNLRRTRQLVSVIERELDSAVSSTAVEEVTDTCSVAYPTGRSKGTDKEVRFLLKPIVYDHPDDVKTSGAKSKAAAAAERLLMRSPPRRPLERFFSAASLSPGSPKASTSPKGGPAASPQYLSPHNSGLSMPLPLATPVSQPGEAPMEMSMQSVLPDSGEIDPDGFDFSRTQRMASPADDTESEEPCLGGTFLAIDDVDGLLDLRRKSVDATVLATLAAAVATTFWKPSMIVRFTIAVHRKAMLGRRDLHTFHPAMRKGPIAVAAVGWEGVLLLLLEDTHLLCAVLFAVNFAVSGSFSDMLPSAGSFIYALVAAPRPSTKWWSLCLVWFHVVLVLKCVLQALSMTVIDKSSGTDSAASRWLLGHLGDSFFPNVLFDFVAIIAILLHLHCQAYLGVGMAQQPVRSYSSGRSNASDKQSVLSVTTHGSRMSRKRSVKSLTTRSNISASVMQQIAVESLLPWNWDLRAIVKAAASFANNATSTHRHKVELEKRDLHTICMGIDMLAFALFAFLYSFLQGREEVVITESITQNLIPGPMVLICLGLFFIILAERIVYLLKSLAAKFAMQVVLALLYHIAYFAWWNSGALDESAHGAGAVILLLKALWLGLSAYQIRTGYPDAVDGQHDCFTLRGESLFWQGLYFVVRIIPLVWEFRVILDWCTATTTLSLNEWLQLEDVRYELYQAKQILQEKLHSNPTPAARTPVIDKLQRGWSIILGLTVLVFFPLMYYSTFSPLLHSNTVSEVSVNLRFENTPPFYADHILIRDRHKDGVLAAALARTRESARDLDVESGKKNLQLMSLSATSSEIWPITKPAIDSLTMLLNSSRPPSIIMTIEVTRTDGDPAALNLHASTSYDLASPQRAVTRQRISDLVRTAAANGTAQAPLPKFFSPWLLSRPLTLKVNTSRPYIDCVLGVNASAGDGEGDTFFSFQCKSLFRRGNYPTSADDSDGNVNYDNGDPGCVASDCHPLVPGYLLAVSDLVNSSTGFLAGVGIVAFYVTFVLAAGSIIREAATGGSHFVSLRCMADPAPVAMLAEHVHLARRAGELALEEELFNLLINLLRSGETILRLTGLRGVKKVKAEHRGLLSTVAASSK